MKVLHLIHDDKFFHFTRDVFSALEGMENRFVAFMPGDAPAAHLGGLTLWRRVDRDYPGSRHAREDFAWCDCLVVHFLTPFGARVVRRAPARVRVVWSGWGGDYFALLPEEERSLLQPETAALVAGLRPPAGAAGWRARAGGVVSALARRWVERPLLAAAAARADFFSAPLEADYEFVRRALGPRFRARYIQLHYGSVERTFRAGPADLTGGDILVGNSATPTNNHPEILRLLADHDLGERKVVVPLSYGDPAYRDAVLALGRRLLGERFAPLTGFLPLERYNAVIANCSCAIMNQLRQQAIGNIGAILYRGARLYLNESGVLYRFFRDRGAQVEGTHSLQAGRGGAFDPLPANELARNRALVESLWSDAVVKRNMASFAATLGAPA